MFFLAVETAAALILFVREISGLCEVAGLLSFFEAPLL